MAYNNGFPMNYQQIYPSYNYVPQQVVPVNQPTVVPQPQQNDNGILWVQGEAGAKSWAVAPGKSVMLMDSESNTFYIKSSDQSGMPMPLRIFDYTERHSEGQKQSEIQRQPEIDTSKFVTWDALNSTINEVLNNRFNELFSHRDEKKEDK